MVLVIRDILTSPPSEWMSFRELTLFTKVSVDCDIVIESANPIEYREFLRPRGCLDFVADFVTPGTEKGIYLDAEARSGPTVVAKVIHPGNVRTLTLKVLSAFSRAGHYVRWYLR